MEQFQLLLQIRQILAPVTLSASDAFMTSHILNLPDIVCFKPVHQDTWSELPTVFYFRVDTLYRFHYFTDHVAGLLQREEICWLQVSFFNQLLYLQDRLAFRDPFFPHNKIYLVAAACWTVAAKACPGAGLRLNLKARSFIIVQGTAQAAISVGFQVIMWKHS